MIETSQLQTLVAVAKSSSFSKAADELHVTQSAISQSIKNLENKIAVKLFKRSGKRVVLTTEGEKLYHLASDFLGQMGETLQEIRFDKNSMSGRVRIGTLIGIGKSWLAPELLALAKEFPDLSVHVSLGFQEELVRDFENMRLDFLILPEQSLPTVGEKVFLSEETSTLVFPKTDEFQIGDDLTLEELAAMPTVLFENRDPLYNHWCRQRFGDVPKKINLKYVINSHGNMLQAVLQGLGVAVVPNHVLRRSYYKDKVNYLGKNFEVSHSKFYIVYHKESKDLLRMRTVLEKLRSSKNPLSLGIT